jgi:hypothetical protein
MPFVAQPELETESVVDGDDVLNEQGCGPLVDDTPPLAQRDVEGVRRKLNTPVPSAKLSLMKCRYSPPNFIECRPLGRLNVSATT